MYNVHRYVLIIGLS